MLVRELAGFYQLFAREMLNCKRYSFDRSFAFFGHYTSKISLATIQQFEYSNHPFKDKCKQNLYDSRTEI